MVCDGFNYPRERVYCFARDRETVKIVKQEFYVHVHVS